MKKKSKINYLDYIPVQKFEWYIDESTAKVVIKREKFDNKLLQKFFSPRLKKTYFEIKLDDFGTLVWTNCDGKKSILQISDILKDKFGEQVEPVYERVSMFIKRLEQERIVELLEV